VLAIAIGKEVVSLAPGNETFKQRLQRFQATPANKALALTKVVFEQGQVLRFDIGFLYICLNSRPDPALCRALLLTPLSLQ
jgi:hypothetical protein